MIDHNLIYMQWLKGGTFRVSSQVWEFEILHASTGVQNLWLKKTKNNSTVVVNYKSLHLYI